MNNCDILTGLRNMCCIRNALVNMISWSFLCLSLCVTAAPGKGKGGGGGGSGDNSDELNPISVSLDEDYVFRTSYLTNHKLSLGKFDGSEYGSSIIEANWPSYSPDGESIIFAKRRYLDSFDAWTSDLTIINVNDLKAYGNDEEVIEDYINLLYEGASIQNGLLVYHPYYPSMPKWIEYNGSNYVLIRQSDFSIENSNERIAHASFLPIRQSVAGEWIVDTTDGQVPLCIGGNPHASCVEVATESFNVTYIRDWHLSGRFLYVVGVDGAKRDELGALYARKLLRLKLSCPVTGPSCPEEEQSESPIFVGPIEDITPATEEFELHLPVSVTADQGNTVFLSTVRYEWTKNGNLGPESGALWTLTETAGTFESILMFDSGDLKKNQQYRISTLRVDECGEWLLMESSFGNDLRLSSTSSTSGSDAEILYPEIYQEEPSWRPGKPFGSCAPAE